MQNSLENNFKIIAFFACVGLFIVYIDYIEQRNRALDDGVNDMGAGCYYTLPDSREIKAYWINIEIQEEDLEDETAGSFYYDLLIEDLTACLLELPLCTDYNGQLYYGKNHKIDLDSTYYGCGILINLVIDLHNYDEKYNFVLSNLERVYNKIIRHVNQRFELRKATSGYTACTIERGTIK